MKVEKIIAKMKRTRFGHTFEGCEKVLLSKGYILSTIKGSHHTYRDSAGKKITLAKHKPMSPDAIRDIIKIYEE
jgi:predicted RNA binding protein YcfA (HicA-like mRNA interferase family)